MRLIPIVMAAACAVALVGVASPARADGRHDGGGWHRPDGRDGWHRREGNWRDGGWRRGEREDGEGYRPVYGYAPPVYYAPRPYYAPPHVVFGFSIP